MNVHRYIIGSSLSRLSEIYGSWVVAEAMWWMGVSLTYVCSYMWFLQLIH